MGMESPLCREEALFSNPDCTIWQCRCGIYHVRIHAATLHLTAAQFERVARIFKLMMGRAAGIGMPSPMPHAGLERGEVNNAERSRPDRFGPAPASFEKI